MRRQHVHTVRHHLQVCRHDSSWPCACTFNIVFVRLCAFVYARCSVEMNGTKLDLHASGGTHPHVMQGLA